MILRFVLTFAIVVRATLGDATAKPSVGTVQSAADAKNNSQISTTTNSPQNSTSLIVVQRLCEFCNCTDHVVNCGHLKLDTILADSEWPVAPLKYLTFEENVIEHVTQFPKATIDTLILQKNQISKIDARAFKNLTGLRYLDLSYNRLTTEQLLPSSFEGQFAVEDYEPLPKLEHLNLAGNHLHALKHDLFEHMSHLKVLNLSGNPFKVIHTPSINAISSLPYLEELDLSHCQLKTLEVNTFHTLRYLKKLDLSHNQFSKPPRALEDVESLQSLRLDFNLFDFSETFPSMPNLKNLSLSHMPSLITIPQEAFSGLLVLEVLEIENCPNLRLIDEYAFMNNETKMWPPVKKLNLSNNSLAYVPPNLLIWHKLEELHLMNNQLSCDCRNQHLIGSLLPKYGVTLMGNEVEKLTCSGPEPHAGKTLMSLATHHLRCLDKYDAHPERDGIILLGVLIGLLLALPTITALYILYLRGFIFCGKNNPATFSRAFYRRTQPYDEEF